MFPVTYSIILYFLTRCSIGHTRVSHNFILNEEHYLKVVHVIPFILYMLNIFHITVWLVLIFDEHFMRSILKLICRSQLIVLHFVLQVIQLVCYQFYLWICNKVSKVNKSSCLLWHQDSNTLK
jgi:hypothetical protein